MKGATQWFERDRPLKFRVWNGHEFTDECSLIMGMDGDALMHIVSPLWPLPMVLWTKCVKTQLKRAVCQNP